MTPPAPFLAALLCAAALSAAAAPKPAPADLDAFAKALPAPGHDRVFLALPADLRARLGIDPAALRAIDPGVACDRSATIPAMAEATLGPAAHVELVCTPDGRGTATLSLSDGSRYVTTCGRRGVHVDAHLDVTVGDQSLHASTTAPPSARRPAHDCSGWTKLPR